MSEQLVKEQTLGSVETQRSELKLCDVPQISAPSLLDVDLASLSPEMTASHVAGEIPPLTEPQMINIGRAAHCPNLAAKRFATPVFDEKLTSRPRYSKKRKQFTIDNFDSGHQRLSFDQHYSKGMQDAIFNTKQESILDTKPGHLQTIQEPENSRVDLLELQPERIYEKLSEKIIDELLTNVQLSAKEKVQITDNRSITRRVASMIGTFVIDNSARLGLVGKDETTITLSNDEKVKDIGLKQLKAKRIQFVKTLSFNSHDCYSRVIPIDVVHRLEKKSPKSSVKSSVESSVKCIIDKPKPSKDGEIRCKLKAKNSEAAHELLVELANLPQPRDFSKVIVLLEEVIEYAVCARFHQEKARAGLHRLQQHFFKTVDEKQKPERAAEQAQLEQWLSQMIEPLLSCAIVNQCEVTAGHSNDKQSEHFKDTSSNEPTKTVKQDLELPSRSPAFLVFNSGASNPKSAVYEITLFPHASGVTSVQFKPYTGWNSAQKDLLPERLVETIAKSKLTSGDIIRRGRVYVYWNPGSFGRVKIGYTEQNTTKDRMKQWEARCGFDVLEHGFEKEGEDQISHPLRVERLIHAELKDQRCAMVACPGCGASHGEWFRIDEKTALAVVKKWTDWMRTSDPYDESGAFKTDVKMMLPPMIGGQEARVILKPARRGRISSHSTRQTPRRSLQNVTKEAIQQSKRA